MRILILGDICGPSGVKAIQLRLKKIIQEKKIDFTIANGENAADNGKGITKKNFNELTKAGINVITSGNHIWDQKEILDIIDNEKRLIRPANLLEGQPGQGFGIYKVNSKKIAVINLLLVLILLTVYIAIEDMNKLVTMNSRLLPIIIPTKSTIDVVAINPIRASNKIVNNIAATVIGIRNSENSS